MTTETDETMHLDAALHLDHAKNLTALRSTHEHDAEARRHKYHAKMIRALAAATPTSEE